MAHSSPRQKTPSLEEFVENVEVGDSPKYTDANEVYTRAEQRRIIRRVDFRLIFPLGLMLGASFLDRANIGNAAIAG